MKVDCDWFAVSIPINSSFLMGCKTQKFARIVLWTSALNNNNEIRLYIDGETIDEENEQDLGLFRYQT